MIRVNWEQKYRFSCKGKILSRDNSRRQRYKSQKFQKPVWNKRYTICKPRRNHKRNLRNDWLYSTLLICKYGDSSFCRYRNF